MSPKLDVFNLGQRGVILNESPVHKQDGDITKGQNVIHSKEEGIGGLRKRGGLTKVNTNAAAGSITGLINLPFPDQDSLTGTLYAGINVEDTDWGTATWLRSTNGTTFATVTSPTALVQRTKLQSNWCNPRPLAVLDDVLYFAGNDYTQGTDPPTVHAWDGTNDYIVFEVPTHPSLADESDGIRTIAALNGKIYIATVDEDSTIGGNDEGRIFEYDPETGEAFQVGNAFGNASGEVTGGHPEAMVWWNGRLWATTNPGSTGGPVAATDGTVVWIRPGIDSTWTTDRTFTNRIGLSMAVFQGSLYVGTASTLTTTTTCAIERRTSAGTWSDSDTGDAQNSAQFNSLIVFGGNLFAVEYSAAGAGILSVRKYDGTTWTEDVDLKTFYVVSALLPGMLASHGGNLYYFNGSRVSSGNFIVRRVSGTWTADGSELYTTNDLVNPVFASVNI